MKTGLLSVVFFFALALIAGAAEPLTLPATAHNHRVKFTATAARYETAYGDYAAEEGRRLLVLTATWENTIDPALAAERNLPLRSMDDNLRESVSLLLDHRTAVPALVLDVNTANLDTQDPDVVGHSGGATDSSYIRSVVGLKDSRGKRAQAYFELAGPGDKSTGDLLFSLPAGDWKSLELVYRDPLGGNFQVLLGGTMTISRDPVSLQTNQVLALAAAVAEDPAKSESPAPAGRRFVAIDFQGKSLLKVRDNLPPYDPTHEAGAEGWRADGAGWVELRHGLQLVADGTLPCGLEPASDVPDNGSFSPDVWTHYRLVYLVPVQAKTIDLVCYFPNYTIPGLEGEVTPKPMTFHLAGPVAGGAASPAKAEALIKDGALELSVVRHSTVAAFAGVAAAPGEKFLVVDYLLRNTGTEGESFKAPEQLVYFSPEGARAPDECSALGPFTAPDYFGLAAGEARQFQAVWRVPAKPVVAEMGLKGNFVAEKFKLKLTAP